MSFGRPYISKIRGCIHDGWLAISDFEDDLNTDYLYHVLQSHAMQMEFSQRASSGTVSNLNADIVKSVQVPLPPIEEQIQIARVLNNFESILNSNVQGLPAEIEARRQQYEYYRNKLLTFKELEVV
jgi:type I restriction enzyme S subunit